MRRTFLLGALALLLSLGSGCASVIRLELPDEFKHKKLKEDPPISMILPQAHAPAFQEA